MATEAISGNLPQSTSRYRTLRGKSISSPRVLDIFRDNDKHQESPMRRLRSSSVHSLRAGRSEKSAPNVPPLPSYALTPKPINIPPPPTFKYRDDGRRPDNAAQTQSGSDEVHDKYHSEPFDEQSLPPLQRTKSKSKRLGFGKKETVETELVPDVARLEADAQRNIAEQKRQDLARLQATLVTPPPKAKTSLLSLFSRSKKVPMPAQTHPDTPSSVATTVFTSRGNSLETSSNPDSIKYADLMEKPTSVSTPTPELTSATNTPPNFERVSANSPISRDLTDSCAKRVAVRCQSSTINLPVTLETNAVDILFMASTMTRHHINPASSVVVESYLMLGLERRLRRYERIRDVMNSWDQDHENSLLILACPASMTDHDLDIDAVPNTDETPQGFTLQLYQSSRPGKWNKRWITLLENGQMYSAKTADALPGDGNSMQLSHMADFDIYSPKEAEIKQTVKPPKKFCYAIKSQQKSLLFPDEDNFVHFFSTDNEEVATQFYEMVHGWRSWHLVARKLALDRKMNAPAPQITFDSTNGSETSADDSKSDSEPSSATSSFRIGAFQPLLDMDNISKLAEEARKLQPPAPKPAPVEEKTEVPPPPPSFPPPATPVKLGNQTTKPNLRQAEMEKYPGSPGQAYNSSPGPARMDSLIGSPQLNSSLEFDAFNFEVAEAKPEPKSWFPSATEHTAKMRKDEPPPLFRRPATADPALQGSQRRANPQLSINTHFLEPPRPFDHFGPPPPKSSPNTPFIYKLPGTPMMPATPRGRPMPRSNSGNIGPPPPPNAMRPRSRSTAAAPQGKRFMSDNMPPVPPLPNRSVRRDVPMPPAMPVPLSVQPRHPPPQRGSALQPFPTRHI
ncbi:hypothetical protein NLG97_g6027 [Lecanicillium saksenae]|uniref:Uncharacterized protein n=1 Tax=Lecanicillium saksenae TaxID=468837 RepID=A0ACC1QQY6_9HYPO|nr:hypothetical protein NLG97_g6027 [Lecanicillium saksenae]